MQEKKAGTNLLCKLRIMVGKFKKLICIDQSWFYIFSHMQEFKNAWHGFKIF